MEILRGGGEDVQSIIKRFKRGQLDLMICGHDFARTHIEDLFDLDLSCIIVDECHRIKNPKAATTAAFMRFETRRRFGLTGTAIQNDYKELHTILNCASAVLRARLTAQGPVPARSARQINGTSGSPIRSRRPRRSTRATPSSPRAANAPRSSSTTSSRASSSVGPRTSSPISCPRSAIRSSTAP